MTTASRQSSVPAVAPHEHAWSVESTHATSMGRVLYVRCDECHTRRVDVQEHVDLPPVALSSEIR